MMRTILFRFAFSLLIIIIIQIQLTLTCQFNFTISDSEQQLSPVKMKAIGLDNVTIVDNPPIALDIIRKRALTDMQEEPLYICDLTDIIKKHRIWTQFLPRVVPFYGESKTKLQLL